MRAQLQTPGPLRTPVLGTLSSQVEGGGALGTPGWAHLEQGGVVAGGAWWPGELHLDPVPAGRAWFWGEGVFGSQYLGGGIPAEPWDRAGCCPFFRGDQAGVPLTEAWSRYGT